MAIRKRLAQLLGKGPPPTPKKRKVRLSDTIFKALGIPKKYIKVFSMQMAYSSDDGIHPKSLPVQDVLAMVRAPNWNDNAETFYRNRIKSPLTGIRAYCVFCSGGSPKAADRCANVTCSLWAFRKGKNPFYGKLTEGNAEASD